MDSVGCLLILYDMTINITSSCSYSARYLDHSHQIYTLKKQSAFKTLHRKASISDIRYFLSVSLLQWKGVLSKIFPLAQGSSFREYPLLKLLSTLFTPQVPGVSRNTADGVCKEFSQKQVFWDGQLCLERTQHPP